MDASLAYACCSGILRNHKWEVPENRGVASSYIWNSLGQGLPLPFLTKRLFLPKNAIS